MLYVKEANAADVEKEWQFVRDMPEDENGLTNRWSGVGREEFEARVLPDMLRFSKGIGLPDWMVPETFLFLWNDGEIVGQFRIRHYLNDALREGAGHIGYFIDRAHRGRGYATEGLRLTLDAAREIVPEGEFYLRVNKDNPASLRVMQKNGGRIVGENEDKYFVRIPNPGKRPMRLQAVSGGLTVCKLASVADAGLSRDFFFLGKTDEEISLVCRTEDAPENALAREDGWRAFRVEGTLDFSLVGILAKISGALAEAGVGLFAVSTYNTDYILVKEESFDRALAALAAAGYETGGGESLKGERDA